MPISMTWSYKSSLKRFGLIAVLVFAVKGISVLIGTLLLAGAFRTKKPSNPEMINGMFIDSTIK